ncbi:MAG: V-type ATP synthase subunit D [Syntrophaceae bacterium]|nr:V-type ATP synthase subunit D [Syntrophaceae bacterium]
MLQRIKFNKVTLREQKQKMSLYQRFLPTLEARKQQFLMQLSIVRKEIREHDQALSRLMKDMSEWSALIRDMEGMLKPCLEIRQVKVSLRNVAGLKIPLFEEVVFQNTTHSLFATAYSFEIVLGHLHEAIRLREKLKILSEQERVLAEGFRKTSQRINLYEQRLIPECREVLHRISVYLQDQQAAAVGVAKVAKRLLEAGL